MVEGYQADAETRRGGNENRPAADVSPFAEAVWAFCAGGAGFGVIYKTVGAGGGGLGFVGFYLTAEDRGGFYYLDSETLPFYLNAETRRGYIYRIIDSGL